MGEAISSIMALTAGVPPNVVSDLSDSINPLETGVKTGVEMDNSGAAQECPCVSFSAVNYSVDLPDGTTKQILNNVHGLLAPNSLTALMGPSGSGKTTVLDILANRKTVGNIDGQILFEGKTCPRSQLKRVVGYVEQFDTLVPELTVRQMMLYTAALKLQVSTEEREARVDEVIEQLELKACQDTLIGDSLSKGVSGGEAKRVNIGLSLIPSPPVMLLDEPTTGLDSHIANGVVALLAKLAHGRTICCTIRSPTARAFGYFDQLLLLRQGCNIYCGPVAPVTNYLTQLGAPERSPDASLVEWIVEVTANESNNEANSTSKGDSEGKHLDLADFYAKGLGLTYSKQLQAQVELAGNRNTDFSSSKHIRTPSLMHSVVTLLRHRGLALYKSPAWIAPRIMEKCFMGLFTMMIYYDLGGKNEADDIQSVAGGLYFITAICGYGSAAFMPALTLDRPIFYRERADGYYSASAYFLSKFLAEALMAALTSLIFSVIVFFSMGLQGSFGVFLLTYYLTTMIGIVLAYCISSLVPDLGAANALLPTYVTICMYFGGLFILFDKIGDWCAWYGYSTFLRYGFSALMINQFGGQTNGESLVYDGQNVLQFYGLDSSRDFAGDQWVAIGMLAGIMVVWGVFGLITINFVSHQSR